MVNPVSYPGDPVKKRRRSKSSRTNQSLLGGRHALSCFTLFFCLSLVYFIVYISQDGDSFLDRAWSELDNLELIFDGVNKPTLVSEWNCTDTTIDGLLNLSGNKRIRMCEFTNFCVDRDRGPFLVQNSSKPRPPSVNLFAASKEYDREWQPYIFAQFPSRRYSLIDEKVFIYGLYSPHDFGHWMFNGLLPLWSVMRSYNATGSSWLFRADVWDGDHAPSRFDMSYLSPKGRDIVLDPFHKTSAFQIIAPGSTVPVCFTHAIVGLGNRCSHKFCDGNVGGEDALTLKERIFQHYKVDIDALASAAADRQKQQGKKSTTVISASPKVQAPKDFNIGLIYRQDVQKIVNFDKLYDELESRGYNLQIIDLNSNNNDQFIESAFLFRNLSLLISPHGSALSNALFMPQSSTVLSISSRFGNDNQEALFAGPMLSLGRRFYDWECPDESCVVTDGSLARQCLEQANLEQTITPQEFEDFMNLEHPVAEFTRHVKDAKKVEMITDAWWCYVRDAPRKVDVDLFVSMVEKIAEDHIKWSPQIQTEPPVDDTNSTTLVAAETPTDQKLGPSPANAMLSTEVPTEVSNRLEGDAVIESTESPTANTESSRPTSTIATVSIPSFPDLCQQAKCCGPKCEVSMKRNVFGPINVWKQSVEHGLENHVKTRNWKLAEEAERLYKQSVTA